MDHERELNKRQRDMYDFIVQFCEERTYPPTVREIGAAVGLKSTSNVHGYLKDLERMGYIRMGAGKQRTISVVRQGSDVTEQNKVINVPIVGAVAAGSPILAFDDIRGYQPMAQACLHGAEPSEVFMLDVEGESMIKAGICSGDRIIVHTGLAVQNGDIAVVRVSSVYGDAATVKRIYREKDFVRLQPENDAMKPIVVPADGVQVVGRVIGLYREY